jgi:hypothetical protein
MSPPVTAKKTGDKTQNEAETMFDRFHSPARLLNELISDPDFSSVVSTNSHSFRAKIFYEVNDDAKQIKITMPRQYMLENRGFSGAGAYSETHPVLDGTLGGFLTDLKYRIVVLASIRQAITRANIELLQVGGTTDLDKRLLTVKVTTLQVQSFGTAFQDALTKLTSNSFLSDSEKKQFGLVKALYLPASILNVENAGIGK